MPVTVGAFDRKQELCDTVIHCTKTWPTLGIAAKPKLHFAGHLANRTAQAFVQQVSLGMSELFGT
jgi:hypothetical protein